MRRTDRDGLRPSYSCLLGRPNRSYANRLMAAAIRMGAGSPPRCYPAINLQLSDVDDVQRWGPPSAYTAYVVGRGSRSQRVAPVLFLRRT